MELNEQRMIHGLVQAFRAGYPHLKLEVVFEARSTPLGVWAATVRTSDGNKVVAKGFRRQQALAVGAALEGIPEHYRRSPEH